MSVFEDIASKIIKEQAMVIGPLAWKEAGKVTGLNILDQKSGSVNVANGDPRQIIDKLVARYDRLFGELSHEVSRAAASPFLTHLAPTDVPSSLK